MSYQNDLSITFCKDAEEAAAQGFLYREPNYLPIRVERVVVVQNGTMAGKPTVDFILVDESGQKYVFMLTAALLYSISSLK